MLYVHNTLHLAFFLQLFMACLCNLQAAQILNEIDTERLFSNLPEIYVANRQFWAEHVFPMLKNARSARAPLDPTSLREGFLKVTTQKNAAMQNDPSLDLTYSCETICEADFKLIDKSFWQFDELFHPYTKYCLDQSQCQQYCKEKDHDNELFKAYLAVSYALVITQKMNIVLTCILFMFWVHLKVVRDAARLQPP